LAVSPSQPSILNLPTASVGDQRRSRRPLVRGQPKHQRVAFLYIDGHVHPYYGQHPLAKAKKPQHQVAQPGATDMVGQQYDPTAFADWFHDQLVDWSRTAPNGHATQHAFRKTGLQFAYRGGVASKKVAQDASITESVMLDHYVDETDDELRLKSNQTFARIASSLPPKVAERYDYFPQREGARPEEVLRVAIEQKDFQAARAILDQMEKEARSGNGSPA
jgi:hypothetical protein